MESKPEADRLPPTMRGAVVVEFEDEPWSAPVSFFSEEVQAKETAIRVKEDEMFKAVLEPVLAMGDTGAQGELMELLAEIMFLTY